MQTFFTATLFKGEEKWGIPVLANVVLPHTLEKRNRPYFWLSFTARQPRG
jgi:hypothetical protein